MNGQRVDKRIPLRDRMNDWSSFETKLFNLVTTDGDRDMIFSERLTATQKMLDALDEVADTVNKLELCNTMIARWETYKRHLTRQPGTPR